MKGERSVKRVTTMIWQAGDMGPEACRGLGSKSLWPYIECPDWAVLTRIKVLFLAFQSHKSQFKISSNWLWFDWENGQMLLEKGFVAIQAG